MYYMDMKQTIDATTMRIKKSTRATLRMIYAVTGEKMISIVERLAIAELERIKAEMNREESEKKR